MPSSAPTWEETQAISDAPAWDDTQPVETRRKAVSPPQSESSRAMESAMEGESRAFRAGGVPLSMTEEERQQALAAPGRALAAIPETIAKVGGEALRTAAQVVNPMTYLPEDQRPRPFIITPGEIRTMTPAESAARSPLTAPNLPLIPARRTQLHPEGSDAARQIEQLSTLENISLLAAGGESKVIGGAILASMFPQVWEDVKAIGKGNLSDEQKRDRINALVMPLAIGLRHMKPGGPETLTPNETFEVPPPLEFTGEALPGRPKGATPIIPTAGPEVLGPPAPRRARPGVEVPGTPAEPRETVVEEIRRRQLKTKGQIQRAFPQLNRERAAELRDIAWGKPPQEPPPAPEQPPSEPPAPPAPTEPPAPPARPAGVEPSPEPPQSPPGATTPPPAEPEARAPIETEADLQKQLAAETGEEPAPAEAPPAPGTTNLRSQIGAFPKGTKVALTGARGEDPLNPWVEIRLPNGELFHTPPEWIGEERALTENLPQLVKRLGRDKVDQLIGDWDRDAHLSPDGKSIYTLSDPRNRTGKVRASTKDFLRYVSDQTRVPETEPAVPETEPPPAEPVPPAAPVAKQYHGRTLEEWFAVKDTGELPKGKAREEFAKLLGVPNRPSAILNALKNDQTRIRRRVAEIEKPFEPQTAPVEEPQTPPVSAAPGTVPSEPPSVEPQVTPEPPPPKSGETTPVLTPPVEIPNAAKIADLKRQLAAEQKKLDKNVAKMGSMVPPPIVSEVTRKIATRMAKIQDQIDQLSKTPEQPSSPATPPEAATEPPKPETNPPVPETKQAKAATPQVEAAAEKVEDQVAQTAAQEGKRAASAVKKDLVSSIEAEIAKLPELKGEVEFSKPKTYNGSQRITARTTGEQIGQYLTLQERRTGQWDVIRSDLSGDKTPVELKQTLAQGVPLQDAKAIARERLLQGNLWDPSKPVTKSGKDLTKAELKKAALEFSKTPENVTIDIPGDGTFTVPKTRYALGRMLSRAKAIATSSEPPKGYTESLPTRAQGKEFAKEAEQPPETPPSMGPGAAAAAEFEQPPAREVLDLDTGNPLWNRIERGYQNFFAGMRQLFSRRQQKRDITQLMDAADNLPRIAGQQAGNSLRLRANLDEQKAITMLMQSLKMSGQGLSQEDAARLGELEFAGDPIGWLKANQTDLETKAQEFLNSGQKLEAAAAVDAAKALRLARERFNQLRPLAELSKRKLDTQLSRESAAGIDTEYENWYVPQRHELDLFASADRPIILGDSRGGGMGAGFRKAKVFESYPEAIEAGFIPRSLSIADLIEHRVNQGERMVTRKAFFDNLSTVSDPADGNPIVKDIPIRQIKRPDGTITRQEAVPLGYYPKEVIPGVRVAVHRGYERLINALTATSQISESALLGSLQSVAAVEKHLMLALDTFHASRTLQAELALTHKLSLGQRQRLGRALVEYSPADLDAAVNAGEITQEMADYIRTRQPIEVHGRTVQMSPKDVLNIGLKNGLNAARFADVLYKDWLRNVPITGPINRWVFDKMTRSAIAHSFIAEFERVAKAHPELDAKRVALNVSRDINVLFGNLQKESLFRNPSVRAINQILFLAPQWVESLARREARAALQLGQSALGAAKGEGVRLGSAGRAIGTGIAAYFVATQIANLITRKHLTFSNPEGGVHRLDAWVPGGPNGFFISPLSVFGEITHDILRYSEDKPDMQAVLAQIGANKLGNLGRFIEVVLTGRDPLTGSKLVGTGRKALKAAAQVVPLPITVSAGVREGLGALGIGQAPPPGAVIRQGAGSFGLKMEPAPSAQRQIYSLADHWKNQQGGKLAAEVERRLKEDFGPSDYSELRAALLRNDTRAARRAYQDLRASGKTPRTIRQTLEHPHPFTGSASSEIKFKRSLTPEQKETYKRAVEERKELARRLRAALQQPNQ